MGCPIHVWVPMMAGLAPVARVARMRLQSALESRRDHADGDAPPRELQRWAPLAPTSTPDPGAD